MSTLDDALEDCLNRMERAEAGLTECLEDHAGVAGDLEPLLSVAERFRCAPEVQPTTAFRSAARARMLNMISSSSAPARPSRPSAFPRLQWRRWGGMGILARMAAILVALLLMAGGGSVVASEALPGSPLYGVKLAAEQVRVTLAARDAARAELHLAMANVRAAEMAAVAERDAPADLDWLIGAYEGAVQSGVREAMRASGSPSTVGEVESRLGAQEEQIRGILGRMGEGEAEKRASLGMALGFLDRERAELRTRMGGTTPSQPSGTPEHPRQSEGAPLAAPVGTPQNGPGPHQTPGAERVTPGPTTGMQGPTSDANGAGGAMQAGPGADPGATATPGERQLREGLSGAPSPTIAPAGAPASAASATAEPEDGGSGAGGPFSSEDPASPGPYSDSGDALCGQEGPGPMGPAESQPTVAPATSTPVGTQAPGPETDSAIAPTTSAQTGAPGPASGPPTAVPGTPGSGGGGQQNGGPSSGGSAGAGGSSSAGGRGR